MKRIRAFSKCVRAFAKRTRAFVDCVYACENRVSDCVCGAYNEAGFYVAGVIWGGAVLCRNYICLIINKKIEIYYGNSKLFA